MAKQPTKKHDPKKHDEPEEGHRETQAAPVAAPKRTQEVGGPSAAPAATPLSSARQAYPRPQHRPQPHFDDPHVSPATRDVINSLQQTVRSQAILITQYQTLLKLEAMDDQGGEGGEGGSKDEAA